MISGRPSRVRLAPRTLTAQEIWPEDNGPRPPDERLPELRRLLPGARRDIVEARPDLWPDDDTGHRRLEKDLARLGATWDGSSWNAPPPRPPPVDSRLLDPERIARAKRMAAEGRSVIATDAQALVAQLDVLLDPARLTTGAQLLEQWRTAQGLSLRQAAKRLGVPHSTVLRWVSGTRTPRARQRALLESTCSIPPHVWVVPTVGTTREAA